jgi:hypothetical protein
LISRVVVGNEKSEKRCKIRTEKYAVGVTSEITGDHHDSSL